jgi:hypothetical protein
MRLRWWPEMDARHWNGDDDRDFGSGEDSPHPDYPGLHQSTVRLFWQSFEYCLRQGDAAALSFLVGYRSRPVFQPLVAEALRRIGNRKAEQGAA